MAAGIVRSGPGAGRDVREWETDILCASEPDGLAAGAGALPGARRRCEAGKRTHGPGPRACLALLAATALLALAAPAQAQQETEIWSATLTPQDLGMGALGCNSIDFNTAVLECSNTAVLSDNDFTLGSTDHTIEFIELSAEGSLQIISTGVFTDADTLVLVLGTTSLAFSAGSRGGDGRLWVSTGISWTAGTDVSVRLISLTAPVAPGAPTGLAATATGPSQIDLAWTAPASTGGSAITGYKARRPRRQHEQYVPPTRDRADRGDTSCHQRRGHLRPRHHHRRHQHRGEGAPTITTAPDADGGTTGDADGLTSPTYTYQWIRVDGTTEASPASTYDVGDADLTTLKVLPDDATTRR